MWGGKFEDGFLFFSLVFCVREFLVGDLDLVVVWWEWGLWVIVFFVFSVVFGSVGIYSESNKGWFGEV